MKNSKFKHNFKKLRCPFVVHADFECLIEKLKKIECDEIKTYTYLEHEPCGSILNLVNAVDIDNANQIFV